MLCVKGDRVPGDSGRHVIDLFWDATTMSIFFTMKYAADIHGHRGLLYKKNSPKQAFLFLLPLSALMVSA